MNFFPISTLPQHCFFLWNCSAFTCCEHRKCRRMSETLFLFLLDEWWMSQSLSMCGLLLISFDFSVSYLAYFCVVVAQIFSYCFWKVHSSLFPFRSLNTITLCGPPPILPSFSKSNWPTFPCLTFTKISCEISRFFLTGHSTSFLFVSYVIIK